MGAQEVMWERPAGREAAGVLLLLNGCNHGADGWWDPQPACKKCLGALAPSSTVFHTVRSSATGAQQRGV